MPAWAPVYFPELTFPVRNIGTDECIITRIIFEVLSISAVEPLNQSSEQPEEKRRDLCYAIIIDLENPKAPQSFQLSVPIPAGETLQLVVAVGAKKSAQIRFVLHLEYDRRRKTRSPEVTLDIINDSEFEQFYQPGIALERFGWLEAKGSRALNIPTGIKPTDMLRSLYLQNRPLNVDYLRLYGPGEAYFFPEDKCPLLPASGSTPIRLEYSSSPTFYVSVGPAYAVRQLTKAEALKLAHDPRLAPPVVGDNPPPTAYGQNEYGACSFAEVPDGFAITQVLPGCGLTGINTEIFTERRAAQFIGAIQREDMQLIPWGEIHQIAIDTVNRYIEVLREFCALHGPIFVRAGLVNVEGLTLAHIYEGSPYKGAVVARGPLRNEHYVFIDFLDHPDPYENGPHILAVWSEIIAEDALAGRMPKILSRD